MRIDQLKTAKQFREERLKESGVLSTEQLMGEYAEHVAKKFAAECVNEALGNKMILLNAIHHTIAERYNKIIWNQE